MISDQNIAQDLAQEVFVIAYRRLADYKPGTKFGAWLNTIARNVAQNERRRWYRKNDLNERYRAEIEKETENHLNSIAGSFRSEILETLRECVKKLEDRSRAIIEDFYFKGKTVKELAHGYNMSEGSVRVTMFRARQAVAECLRKKGAIS